MVALVRFRTELGLTLACTAATLAAATICGGEVCTRGLTYTGAMVPGRLWVDGELWRAVSAGLPHTGALHLAANVSSLWALGPALAAHLDGRARLGLLLLGSVAGVLLSTATVEARVIAGASAGLFAWAGALLALGVSNFKWLNDSSLRIGVGFVLIAGVFVPWLAAWGHIGGLVVGAAFGEAHRRWGHPRGWQLAVPVAVGIGLMVLVPIREPQRAVQSGLRGAAMEPMHLNTKKWLAEAVTLEDWREVNDAAWALAEHKAHLATALRLARRAEELAPRQADVLDTVGWILCLRGRTSEGRQYLKQAVARDERGIPEILDHMARCR